MVLDIVLGVFVLLGAIRGWFRGFVDQAVWLGALVGSAYAASPIREQARPYVAPYLANVPASALDRLLWWGSGVACYLATVIVASLIVRAAKRRTIGDPEPNRADQLAGFLLAAAKGLIVMSFLTSGLDKYVLAWARKVPWADEQAKTSIALTWNQQYHPADRIWTSAPVQHLVGEVWTHGIVGPADSRKADQPETQAVKAEEPKPPEQASIGRTPRLDLPGPLDPGSPDFLEQFDRAVDLYNKSQAVAGNGNPR